jgi:hypothetical protein
LSSAWQSQNRYPSFSLSREKMIYIARAKSLTQMDPFWSTYSEQFAFSSEHYFPFAVECIVNFKLNCILSIKKNLTYLQIAA